MPQIALSAAFLAALAATMFLTPLFKAAAVAWDIVDRPDPLPNPLPNPLPRPLKVQAEPIAYLGGLAILGGLVAGLSVYAASSGYVPAFWFWSFMIGSVILAALGLCDDVRGLPPRVRLEIELAGSSLWSALATSYGILDRPTAVCAVFLLPVCCNAVNLIDGLDGLAAGLMALSGLGGLLIGLHRGEPGLAGLSAVLLGSCLGFLRYNRRPAGIFMGDCGSLLLGFWAAGLGAYWLSGFPSPGRSVDLALLFAVPLADLSWTVLRRAARRRPLFEGDRDHLYDILARSGLGPAGAVYACHAAALAGVLAALWKNIS